MIALAGTATRTSYLVPWRLQWLRANNSISKRFSTFVFLAIAHARNLPLLVWPSTYWVLGVVKELPALFRREINLATSTGLYLTCSTFGTQPWSPWPSVCGKVTSKRTNFLKEPRRRRNLASISGRGMIATSKWVEQTIKAADDFIRPVHWWRRWPEHLGSPSSGAQYFKLQSARRRLQFQSREWRRSWT